MATLLGGEPAVGVGLGIILDRVIAKKGPLDMPFPL
jgi:F0F1-type ATP synthase assembly protein I